MNNLALATEILFHRVFQVGGVHINLIDLIELSSVHTLEDGSDERVYRSEQKRDFLIIELTLVEEVAGDRVRVIYLPGSCTSIADGREGIVAEYDRIILTKELCMEEDSVFEIYLTQTLVISVLSERYEPPRESHRYRIESLRTEKKRREVSTERSGEHYIESLGSTTVQEHIVDEADFFGTIRQH